MRKRLLSPRKRKSRQPPTNCNVGQEIQKKMLEVVGQELFNAQHLRTLQAKQEILTDLKIQKLTHKLQILRGEIGDMHYMVEEVKRV